MVVNKRYKKQVNNLPKDISSEKLRQKDDYEDKMATNVEKYKNNSIQERVRILDTTFLCVLVLSVYVYTLYPSIPGGDSGELVAESCHLGVSHPPGYPLFNMVVFLFTQYFPTSHTPAWKANIFSALCDTLCALFIYLSIKITCERQKLEYRIPAFLAAALFAFSPLIWTYAISAEVFSLNNMFAALLIYLLLLYSKHGNWFYVCSGSLICGLGLCNQHTIILFEIPIIFWVIITQRKILTFQKVVSVAAFFALGLLPYAYMPITSTFNPQHGSWGHVTTLSGFFHHLRRGDYGSFRLFSSNKRTEGLKTRLYLYVVDLTTREGLYVVPFFAFIGIVISMRRNIYPQDKKRVSLHRSKQNPSSLDSIGFVILVTYSFYMIVFHSLANLPLSEGLLYGVHMRFWQQPNVIVFFWTGIGFAKLMDIINPPKHHAKLSRFITIVKLALCVVLVSTQFNRWLTNCNQRDSWYIRNYAKALIDPLPKNSLFLTNYDLQWTSLRYLQRCEKFRTDVTFINLSMMTYQWFQYKHKLYAHLRFPGTHLVPENARNGGFSIKQFVDSNYQYFKKSGIYLGGKLSYNDNDFSHAYESVPIGLLTKFINKNERVSLKKWHSKNRKTMKKVRKHLPSLPPSEFYNDETWEYTVARDYHMRLVEQATFQLEKAIAQASTLKLLVESSNIMEYTYLNEPKSFWPAHLLKNLGLAYAHIVKSPEEFPQNAKDPFEKHVGKSVVDQTKLKDRAANRMLEVWREWLLSDAAKRDPGFDAIKGIVDKFAKN